jgi:hypothetical protein
MNRRDFWQLAYLALSACPMCKVLAADSPGFPMPGKPPRNSALPTPKVQGKMAGGALTNRGCALVGASAGGMDGLLFPSSGNPQLDYAHAQVLEHISSVFRVRPGALFLDDSSGPNAFATPEVLVRGMNDGTVIFGVTLISNQLMEDGGLGHAMPAIMAHEFGHIVQFKSNTHSPGAAMELHADYLAGWYMSKLVSISMVDARQAMRALYSVGDYDFNSPQHHGTPEQRLESLMAGMQDRAGSLNRAFDNGMKLLGGA